MKLKGMLAMGAVALMMTAAMVTGCKRGPVDPFPVVKDWQKSGETRTFKAEDLWQYIDGDSDRYIQAGVVTTSTSDYKYKGALDVTVDVYTMSAAAGAKSIYNDEAGGDAKVVDVGDGGRLYAQSLVFHKGKYLVRIVGFAPAPELAEVMLELGHGVESKM
jgi:hypothetical protein